MIGMHPSWIYPVPHADQVDIVIFLGRLRNLTVAFGFEYIILEYLSITNGRVPACWSSTGALRQKINIRHDKMQDRAQKSWTSCWSVTRPQAPFLVRPWARTWGCLDCTPYTQPSEGCCASGSVTTPLPRARASGMGIGPMPGPWGLATGSEPEQFWLATFLPRVARTEPRGCWGWADQHTCGEMHREKQEQWEGMGGMALRKEWCGIRTVQ